MAMIVYGTAFYCRNKKRMLERAYSTKKLFVKNTEYIWIIYKRLFSTRIRGLLLFNLETGREEDDRQVIEDMLKILYAYLAIYEDRFCLKLPNIKKRLEKEWTKIKNAVENINEELNKAYLGLPIFIRTSIRQILDLFVSILRDEEKMLEGLARILEIIGRIDKEEGVPVQVLLCFLHELQKYEQAIVEIEKMIKEKKETLAEIKAFMEVFPEKASFDSIKKVLEQVFAHVKGLRFYKDFPFINNLVLCSFSERVIEPYKPLVRNTAS